MRRILAFVANAAGMWWHLRCHLGLHGDRTLPQGGYCYWCGLPVHYGWPERWIT